MNKTFTRIFAGALAAASLFALASCGEKKDGDDKSANASTPAPITEAPSVTDEPTAAPTEAPTPTPEPIPTPEPTETPVPWPTDPRGIIPPEVPILVKDSVWSTSEKWCITRVAGKTHAQKWNKDRGLEISIEVPEEILDARAINCASNAGHVSIVGYLTKNHSTLDPSIFIYYSLDSNNGFTFRCTSLVSNNSEILLATQDGYAVIYYWGEKLYRLHNFGGDVYVSDFNFFEADGYCYLIDEIEWEEILF